MRGDLKQWDCGLLTLAAMCGEAETMGGVSFSMVLDTLTGTRNASDNGELLAYDIAWNPLASTAQITDNGGALVSGTTGSYLWSPDSCATLQTLSLKMIDGAGQVLSTETVQSGSIQFT